MSYTELQPRPDLKPYVAAYWHFRVAEDAGEIEHSVPLTGGAILSTSKGPLMLTGPRMAPLRPRVSAGDVFWGVHFWPGAAAALLGPGARGLREQALPAELRLERGWVARLEEALGGVRDEDEATARFDAALSEMLPSAQPLDGPVMTAVFRIIRAGGLQPVEALAESLGLSARQLRRRFRTAVELSAKELSRLRRLRASAVEVVLGPPERWIIIAAEHGYADQAHLVREFRALTGLSPVAFGRHARRISHGGLAEPPEE
jgi:AraC-like DNA-binding protein